MFQNVKNALRIFVLQKCLETYRIWGDIRILIFRKTPGCNYEAGCCLQMQVGWNLWQCAAGRRMTPPSWFPTWFMPGSFCPLHVYPCPPLHPPPYPSCPCPCTTQPYLRPTGPCLPKAKVIKLACCYFRILKCRFPVSYAPPEPA